MHHFAYRDGVLHAEAVNLASLAQAVGTPFYCYSTATLERHYRVFAERLRRRAVAGLLFGQGQLQPGGDRDAGASSAPAPTWCRAASSSARSAAGVPPDKIMFSGIGKTARRACAARSTRTSSASTSSRRPSLSCCPSIAAGKGRTANVSVRVNPDVDAQDPRQDRDRHAPRTSSAFRSAARARSTPRPPSCRGCASPASTCTSAARSPSSSPFDDAFALLSDFVRSAARRRPHDLPCRSRRRPGHSLSRGQRSAARSRRPMRAVVKRATRGLDCKLIFEPGRLIVGNAGILVTRVLYLKRGEAKTFVIVDAGDERPDPADAVRGPSRHPAGGGAGAGRAPHRGGRGRSGVRIGRFPGARPRPGRAQGPAICWRS